MNFQTEQKSYNCQQPHKGQVCQAWFNLVQLFVRKRLKFEKKKKKKKVWGRMKMVNRQKAMRIPHINQVSNENTSHQPGEQWEYLTSTRWAMRIPHINQVSNENTSHQPGELNKKPKKSSAWTRHYHTCWHCLLQGKLPRDRLWTSFTKP